jgi:hypothetical protein
MHDMLLNPIRHHFQFAECAASTGFRDDVIEDKFRKSCSRLLHVQADVEVSERSRIIRNV